MRRSIDGLATDRSLMLGLPAVYLGDDFFEGFVRGFDDCLAPVHAVAADIDAYFDPMLTPDDFLQWLGSWLGLSVNRRWPVQQRREFVAKAVSVFQKRGTVAGIAEAVELYTGVVPQVFDSGGVATSAAPHGSMPGAPRASVKVVITTSDSTIDANLVDRIVADAKPAHVEHEVEVAITEKTKKKKRKKDKPEG